MKSPKRFFKSPKALQRPFRAASRRAGNDRPIGLQRPLDWAATTARLSRNDRTIEPQRPHDSAPTTAQFGPDDRTMPEDGEKR